MGSIGWKLLIIGAAVGLAVNAQTGWDRGLYAEEGVYRVESFRALNELTELVASQEEPFTGEVWLMEDICAEGGMRPIGDPQHMFLGTFDGRGHSITGFRAEGCGEFSGLFGYVGTGGCVKNLTVSDALVLGSRYVGGVAAYCAGRIENCRVRDSRIIGTGDMEYGAAVGGVLGTLTGTAADCVNQESLVMGARSVGGIAGSLCAGSMERCVNTGMVRSRATGRALAGGVAGCVQTGGQMSGCVSAGSVSAFQGTWAGGLVGGIMSGEMKRCLSLDEVRGREAGGVAGYVARRAQVMDCHYADEHLPAAGEGRESGMRRLTCARQTLAGEALSRILERDVNPGTLASDNQACYNEDMNRDGDT